MSSPVSSAPEPSESNFLKILSIISFYIISWFDIKYCFDTCGDKERPSLEFSSSAEFSVPGVPLLLVLKLHFLRSHILVSCCFNCSDSRRMRYSAWSTGGFSFPGIYAFNFFVESDVPYSFGELLRDLIYCSCLCNFLAPIVSPGLNSRDAKCCLGL